LLAKSKLNPSFRLVKVTTKSSYFILSSYTGGRQKGRKAGRLEGWKAGRQEGMKKGRKAERQKATYGQKGQCRKKKDRFPYPQGLYYK
jgi:predicted transposase YdaD